MPPRQIVSELDRYIVGQDDAKKAVAIAVRNRWRRALARLAGARFIKTEGVLFELPERPEKHIRFDAAGVRKRLARIVNDDDLGRYIL